MTTPLITTRTVTDGQVPFDEHTIVFRRPFSGTTEHRVLKGGTCWHCGKTPPTNAVSPAEGDVCLWCGDLAPAAFRVGTAPRRVFVCAPGLLDPFVGYDTPPAFTASGALRGFGDGTAPTPVMTVEIRVAVTHDDKGWIAPYEVSHIALPEEPDTTDPAFRRRWIQRTEDTMGSILFEREMRMALIQHRHTARYSAAHLPTDLWDAFEAARIPCGQMLGYRARFTN